MTGRLLRQKKRMIERKPLGNPNMNLWVYGAHKEAVDVNQRRLMDRNYLSESLHDMGIETDG